MSYKLFVFESPGSFEKHSLWFHQCHQLGQDIWGKELDFEGRVFCLVDCDANQIVSFLTTQGSTIYNLCTHPQYRRLGSASNLLGRVLPQLSRPVDLQIEFDQKEILIPFYARFGFRLHHGYTRKNNLLEMRLT